MYNSTTLYQLIIVNH